MPPVPNDTDPETMRVWIQMWRDASPQRRLALALGSSAQVIQLSKEAIARQHPDWSQKQIGVEFVRVHYGKQFAAALAERLEVDPGRVD
jgi:hypothetical protein